MRLVCGSSLQAHAVPDRDEGGKGKKDDVSDPFLRLEVFGEDMQVCEGDV